MDLFQASVTPLSTPPDLRGKTVIITGASSGLSLETARQMLALNIESVILAVRNVSKGEKCRRGLLADIVADRTSKGVVKVM
jgi:NAD(P)-dependent dehydrogenase (short-subunit alcohol dehydrogenase family)